MHYIRLLRPAKIQSSAGGLVASLLFTITTDLGDSFLCPEDGSIDLVVAAEDTGADPAGPAAVQGTPTSLGALHVGDVLPWRIGTDETLRMGVVMPAAFEFIAGVCAPVSVRTLGLGTGYTGEDTSDKTLDLQFEEDIGESIARHIWDAGVVTSAYLADACSSPESIRGILPIEKESFNVLELGSGVGILGLTIAGILPKAAAAQGQALKNARVLLTDLEEAEERARSNIARAESTLARDLTGDISVTIEYESLGWDEGREGRFGSLAAATPWDLVVLSDCTYNVDSLPALVGTLSALHTAKERHLDLEGNSSVKSAVLLATKPRHSSEEALFELLRDQSWAYKVVKEIPLPKIGEDDEVVQIYLLGKGGHID
ncbi:hypothetical protein GQX73_g4284 [Xylaria multiplex]|uniref:Uncharacterized protein n=1 Tax=Xylaria multiplex TaxID=323545 RepID=A0A7C8MZB1_9PEZI|nr:hypothetical protein GQX73_g4284 [Xylaria multiplex]